MGENYKAFEYLGNSLTHDPKNAKTILAAGSIIQVCAFSRILLALASLASQQLTAAFTRSFSASLPAAAAALRPL